MGDGLRARLAVHVQNGSDGEVHREVGEEARDGVLGRDLHDVEDHSGEREMAAEKDAERVPGSDVAQGVVANAGAEGAETGDVRTRTEIGDEEVPGAHP